MPTRYLKPGICDSEAINALSSPAEVMFYRLLVNVDDFGRLDARPLVVKAKCFPIKEQASSDYVEKLLQELHKVGLILLYQVDGCRYMQVLKWDNQPRAKVSKYPNPPADAYNCIQIPTVLPVTETVTETGKTVPPAAGDKSPDKDFERELFERGLEILTVRGVKESNARSVIGLVRKKVGDVKALELLITLDDKDISDPVPWLTKASETGKKSSAPVLAL